MPNALLPPKKTFSLIFVENAAFCFCLPLPPLSAFPSLSMIKWWAWIWVSVAFMICVSWIILSRAQFIINSQGLHVLANSDECLTVAGPVPAQFPSHPLSTFLKGAKTETESWNCVEHLPQIGFRNRLAIFKALSRFPKCFAIFSRPSLFLLSLSPSPLFRIAFPLSLAKKQQQQHACLGFPSLTWLLFFLLFFFLHSLLVFCCVCVCVCHNKMAPCVCVCAASLSNWLRPGLAALWARSTQIHRQVGGVWRGR